MCYVIYSKGQSKMWASNSPKHKSILLQYFNIPDVVKY